MMSLWDSSLVDSSRGQRLSQLNYQRIPKGILLTRIPFFCSRPPSDFNPTFVMLFCYASEYYCLVAHPRIAFELPGLN